jgi:protein-tyrosine phosphatase
MIPIVDMHVHLLAGLDDGPKTPDEAMKMSQMLVEQGVTTTVALAHQSLKYPENSADRLRQATELFQENVRRNGLDLTVHPSSEVCHQHDLIENWDAGNLLSVGDRKQYLLLEFLNDQAVDLIRLLEALKSRKLRLILAHAERVELWREKPDILIELIRLGCLVQVTAQSMLNPLYARLLKDWAKRGMIHLLGSDGHSPQRRPPVLREGVLVLEQWLGHEAATKIASGNALTILRGDPVVVPLPERSRKSWFGRLFGN